MSTAPLGRVVATADRPSTPHHFQFEVPSTDATVGVGAIVRVDGDGRCVFGVVTDALEWSEAARSTRHFAASVLRHEPPEPLQPVPLGPVFLATDDDVRLALRMEAYAGGEQGTGIPAGLYAAAQHETPAWLDADFLVGPEAAHLNVSGVSGLATKTSVITFTLSSLFQTFPAHRGSIAAVCFNVKGGDLLFLDQPAPLGAVDLARYAKLGIAPTPFTDLSVFAPFKADGMTPNTLRTNEALQHNTKPLVWGLREVLDFAEVVMNRDDVDAKADAFLDFLADRVVGREFRDPTLRDAPFRVTTFTELEEFFRAILDHMEGSRVGEVWRTHHVATIRKVRNRLGNIGTRARGLVTDDGPSSDLPWGEFRDRQLIVVDVAGVDPLAQDLVFARTVSKLREHLERRDLGVEHVVVVVDELNKYAPAEGPDTYVRRMLLDLAERGRYLGLVLFSAQQFRTQVLRRVTGNAGTSYFGRMDSEELSMPAYSTLTPSIRARLASLPKGELMVRHPHFTQPVFLRFPRPAMLGGREGIEQFPPAPEMTFHEGVWRQLRQLDQHLTRNDVTALIDGFEEEDIRRAVGLARRERPQDVLAFVRKVLGRRTTAEIVVTRRGVAPTLSRKDPYDP